MMGRIIKFNLKEMRWEALDWIILLIIATDGCFCEPGFDIWAIPLLGERLLAPQHGPCFMELANYSWNAPSRKRKGKIGRNVTKMFDQR
jgi:hypothetical protein